MEVNKLDITIPSSIFGKDVTLSIYPERNSRAYEIEDLNANENGESRFQLLEGHSYEYTFSDKNFRLDTTISGVICESKRDASCGRITPNIYVGTLTLFVKDISRVDVEYKLYVEVLATKFDNKPDKSYRENYRFMVKEITDKSTELLMQINSPVEQNFEIDFDNDNETIYQRFSFINSIIQDKNFEEALQKIISSPKTTWANIEEEVDTRSLRRLTSHSTKQLISGSNRVLLDTNHPLSKNGLKSIPIKVISNNKIEHLDTPENRFIKHALEVFLQFSEECLSYFKKYKYSRPILEAENLVAKLEANLSHSFFQEISRPTSLRLNSPVLQRKSGYREILSSWLQFDLAAKLIWKGGDDVYKAGKKDIATLYEYWLFFKLYDLFSSKFRFNKVEQDENQYQHLIEPTKDGLNIMVKQGKHTALSGVYISENRSLNIKYSYNRPFKGATNYTDKRAGSYTTTLRPDYTLSVWPAEMEEAVAEENELIVHIHFDAKYKVEQFLFNTSESISEEEEIEERKGIFKNVDLLKMHAYKDAIRRTGGAYVLYPGTEKVERRGFHEIIPGLGAFAINPTENNTGISELSHFIDLVIEHLKDRASQREIISNKSFVVHQNQKKDEDTLQEYMPEYINGQKLIPDDIHVLIAYYKSQEQLDWILKNSKYNFRTGTDKGSLPLISDIVDAAYLILHGQSELKTDKIFALKPTGPKVYSKNDMIKKGYPNPKGELYLIYEIEKEVSDDFQNISIDIRKLPKYKSKRGSGEPFSSTLTEVLRAKVVDL